MPAAEGHTVLTTARGDAADFEPRRRPRRQGGPRRHSLPARLRRGRGPERRCRGVHGVERRLPRDPMRDRVPCAAGRRRHRWTWRGASSAGRVTALSPSGRRDLGLGRDCAARERRFRPRRTLLGGFGPSLGESPGQPVEAGHALAQVGDAAPHGLQARKDDGGEGDADAEDRDQFGCRRLHGNALAGSVVGWWRDRGPGTRQ